MARYSVSRWIYGREPLEQSLDRLARCGYDGVELAGEPDAHDPARLRRLISDRGLVVSSVCGLYTAERDLSHTDAAARAAAVRYVRACCDLAAETGGRLVIVVPSPVGKPAPLAPAEEELRWAVESIRAAGEYAATVEVTLAVEALNRFETYLVNTLAQASALADEVGLPNVGILADAFHMNTEERSLAGAVRAAGDAIRHVHIADSNRESVGRGHTDFAALVAALETAGYAGWYAMEFLPRTAAPYRAADYKADRETFEMFTRECIERLRPLLTE